MTGRTYRKYRAKRTCSSEGWQQRWLVGGGTYYYDDYYYYYYCYYY